MARGGGTAFAWRRKLRTPHIGLWMALVVAGCPASEEGVDADADADADAAIAEVLDAEEPIDTNQPMDAEVDAPPPNGVTWQEVLGPGPTARWGHVAVYDGARDRALVWGGVAEGWKRLDDLWALDLSTLTWSEVTAPGGPSGRFTSGAVIDAERDRMLIFGGDDGEPSDELWLLDLAHHAWVAGAGKGPSPRFDVAAVTDGETAWLYGGFGPGFIALGDLWAYDLASDVWTALHDGSGEAPSPRNNIGLAVTGEALLVVGGHDKDALTPDLWRYELASSTWIALGTTAGMPAQAHFAYAADPGCAALWLAGGDNNDSVDSSQTVGLPFDTPLAWTPLSSDTAPPPRRHAVLVRALTRLVLFGGWQGDHVHLGDTWIFEHPACPGP